MKTVANLPDHGSSFLPLECLHLNRSALVAMVGPQPPLPKHFTLRRKPKSAALRAELITQKASEALSAQKKENLASSGHKLQSPSKKFEAPVRVTQRTSNTSTSYRPTPNRNSSLSGSSRSIISAAMLKHHGKTKLLDITKQPIGDSRELKRRKKMAESEHAEEAKHKKLENTKPLEPTLPDYAAGLTSVTQPSKLPSGPQTTSTSIVPAFSAPSYVPQAGSSTSQSSPSQALSERTVNLKRELELLDITQQPTGDSRDLKRRKEMAVRFTQRTSNTSTSYRPTPNRNSSSSGSSRSIISAATVKHHGRTKLLNITEQPIGDSRELKRRKEMAESEHTEEAKHKRLENTEPLEPTTPDYAAGLTAVTQPSKVIAFQLPSSPEKPLTGMVPPSTAPSYVPQAGSSTSQSSPSDALSESTLNLKRELEMHVEQQRQIMMRERQQKQAAAAALTASSAVSTAPSSVDASKTPSAVPTSATPGSSQQQQGNKRQLALTRDQLLAAHEMFKNANRVSRAEKALILGFMAGAREKPYSHQGPIITIKLSENTENVSASDGSQQTQLVEMLFEMNYDTGHWRRVKRTRVVS